MLTLGGVLISNGSNTKRLKLQLQHDAKEKTKERTATLRREVYLSAAEELVKANAHLATLPQLDLTKTNLADGLQSFLSAAARLELIAEPKTALLVSRLASDYGELVFKLTRHLLPASRAKSDIQVADDLYSKAQAEVTRLISEMSKLNESGRPDPQAFQALDKNLRFQQTQTSKFAGERNTAWNAFNQHNLAFQQYLLTQLRDIGSKHIPIMVELRRDLGLSGDLAELEVHKKQQWVHMESHLNALIAELEDGKSAHRG